MEPEGKQKTQLLGGVEGQEGNTTPPTLTPVPQSTQGAHPTAAHRGRRTLPLPFPKIPQNLYYQLPFRKVRQELLCSVALLSQG